MFNDLNRAVLASIITALIIIVVIIVAAVDWRRPYKIDIIEVAAEVEVPVSIIEELPLPRTVDPYRGLGTWIDAYDLDVDESRDVSALVEDMADHGITTIYLQSGRVSKDSPDEVLFDKWLLADWVLNAHQNDMNVVAWFLPKFRDNNNDLDYLTAAADFSILGHRFDGIGVDIEWVDDDDTTDEERNERLIELSKKFDDYMRGEPVGAIVLPPPFLDEVSPEYWPDFPWDEIDSNYDVWLPMAYWSNRSNSSGYGDGLNYSLASIEGIREHIDDPDALVHGIGGIGATTAEDRLDGAEPIASVDDLPLFADSLVEGDAIGGSIYDWLTQDATARQTMQELFTTGPAARLAIEPEPAN